jgi:hypothetical protein
MVGSGRERCEMMSWVVVGWVLLGKRRQAAALHGSCFALLLAGAGRPIQCATGSAATKKTAGVAVATPGCSRC